jgi:hypothetical protein
VQEERRRVVGSSKGERVRRILGTQWGLLSFDEGREEVQGRRGCIGTAERGTIVVQEEEEGRR